MLPNILSANSSRENIILETLSAQKLLGFFFICYKFLLDIQENIDEFWIDWDVPVPQLDVDIELPETDNSLNSQMMQSLRDQFDVTEESDDFGIEMYLSVKRYVENLIV